ncbi:uncharacterized protein MELLADRAFT_59804 [Melampsora larici-populina 98AG31]|uniref:Uncharacterized protein n=1 Tax=Melampsora larici-populina (strain 98AG31 / pathotype 3-4-7) TaxID=747676 RepID=F4R8U8_MELLP|nr:uncharacterized protein MELLADRAFT_59804 [Melampsora larici-populina 98AG31]EGG10870.1 hypothetical protein MELLADRAFT_59804 [Melampsora larici-populina 98AG31]
MLPPFSANPYARHNQAMLPELRELVNDQPHVPIIGPGDEGPIQRVRQWERVKRYLHNGFFHNTGHALDEFVEQFGYLNAAELGTIIDAIYTLEDEVHDVISHMSECLNLIAYCEMVLRSRDPEVTCHHDLIKRQLEISKMQYERYQLAWQHFHQEESKLWAIWSEETHRARAFPDAQPGAASNSTPPVSDQL